MHLQAITVVVSISSAIPLATGGLAKVIVPHCKHNIHIDAELLLKGLRIIYDKNVEGN